MAGGALQVAGLAAGGLGAVGTLAATAMPQWRVSAFIEHNIIVFEAVWEGLWTHCIRQVSIRMQCKGYDSVLALPPALQASRGLMCASSGLSLLALVLAMLGARCPRRPCQAKGCILLAAGLLLILSGVLELVPLCWVANSIISDFYNPAVNVAQKRELGEALYVGWVGSSCLVAAGSMLCCSALCCAEGPRGHRYSSPSGHAESSHSKSSHSKSSHSKSQYV